MGQGFWRSAPALLVAAIALFVALGGSVYAAKKARRIDGRTIKAKSIPGNRLRPRSITADRLRPSVLRRLERANREPLTGVDINELTLGQVPSAAYAELAGSANSAIDAETALNAVNAIDAKTVDGHRAGCLPSTQLFAGACWDTSSSGAVNAPTAARKCAARGGSLPPALELAAFAEEPGLVLKQGDEWTSDIAVFIDLDSYSVATVSPYSEIDASLSTKTRAYRCVVPLVG